MTNECKRCGRPARDQAYVCDQCTDDLGRALGDVPWVVGELETTTTRIKGIDYRRVGGGKGGKKPAERPLPAHWGASEARTHLTDLLRSWVVLCHETGVRSSDVNASLPADNPQAMSRWLLWRVDGLALHDAGPDAIQEITEAIQRAKRVIDRAPDKWFAGPCNEDIEGVECGTDLYAIAAKGDVRCATCGATHDVAKRRAWLLEAAEDRLADATELARSVSWLGSKPLTRDRIYQWARRGRIAAKGTDIKGNPIYRIGDAIDLLAKEAS